MEFSQAMVRIIHGIRIMQGKYLVNRLGVDSRQRRVLNLGSLVRGVVTRGAPVVLLLCELSLR